ncbi:MAG: hypothetical protein QM765_51700 [Myxococcales bacterium]
MRILVGGGAAEPFEAAALHLEGEQALVSQLEVLECARLDVRLGGLVAAQVVEDEDVGEGRGGGLLEAARGHPQHALEALERGGEEPGIDAQQELLAAGDGALGDRGGDGLCLGSQRATDGRLRGHAVRADFDLAAEGVVELGAEGVDGERLFSERLGAQLERHALDLVGRQLDLLDARRERLEPVRGLDLQLHLLGLRQVVVHGDRDLDLVAHGQRRRQIDVDEEVLEGDEGPGADAQAPVRGARGRADAPPGNGVGDRHRHAPLAIGASDDRRRPEHRLREPGADADPGLLGGGGGLG